MKKTFSEYLKETKFDRDANLATTLKHRLTQTYVEDGRIEITYDWKKNKLRALYKHQTRIGLTHNNQPLYGTHGYWVQFPNDLRQEGAVYIADLQSDNPDNPKFFRVIKGTIRREGSDEVVG